MDGGESLPEEDGGEADEDDAADHPQQDPDQVRLRWTFQQTFLLQCPALGLAKKLFLYGKTQYS
jgi:hypothetical protein